MQLYCPDCGAGLIVTQVKKQMLVDPPAPLKYRFVCPWCQERYLLKIGWSEGFQSPKSLVIYRLERRHVQGFKPQKGAAPLVLNWETVIQIHDETQKCYYCRCRHGRVAPARSDGGHVFCSDTCHRAACALKDSLREVPRRDEPWRGEAL